MSDKIVKEILSKKEKNINRLLSLTESPIERIFFAHLLEFIEESIAFGLKNISATLINGYTYCSITDSDPVTLRTNSENFGIRLSFATTIRENISPEYGIFNLEDLKGTDYLKRETRFLINGNNLYKKSIMQSLDIYPQYKVNINNQHFRLDFAFLLHENHEHEIHLVRKVAVECDGYEYHHNKDAFTNDRERHRTLNSDNWIVFQFSGAEINANNSYDTGYFYKEFHKILKTIGFGIYAL